MADSDGLAKFLLGLGCCQVDSENDADLIIINTCAIREKAEQKLFSYIGRLADLKKNKPYLKIGIIGCVASYRKQELYTGFDHINFVHGAREKIGILQEYLIELVKHLKTAKVSALQKGHGRARAIRQVRDLKLFVENLKVNQKEDIENDFSISNLNLKIHACGSSKSASATKVGQPGEIRSFINIMTGCNKYCSYCIVPFTRGREISYSMSQILQAVQRDVDLGIKEINLLGQNVNSYVDPQSGARFPELLQKVSEVSGDFWVRFVSPHPQDITENLFEILAKNRNKLAAYLHFPMQSGSNKILKAMNRSYTVEEYLEKIGWARSFLPGIVITTDMIVGFPGETEEDYLQTRNVMELVKFDQIYSFVYSKRKFTKAYSLPDDCSEKEKFRRLNLLQMRQRDISLECNQAHVGKTLKILVEKQSENGKLLARMEGNTRVIVDGQADLAGKFAKAHIKKASVVDLFGELVD